MMNKLFAPSCRSIGIVHVPVVCVVLFLDYFYVGRHGDLAYFFEGNGKGRG